MAMPPAVADQLKELRQKLDELWRKQQDYFQNCVFEHHDDALGCLKYLEQVCAKQFELLKAIEEHERLWRGIKARHSGARPGVQDWLAAAASDPPSGDSQSGARSGSAHRSSRSKSSLDRSNQGAGSKLSTLWALVPGYLWPSLLVVLLLLLHAWAGFPPVISHGL
jgi:hypothetical protein